MSIKGAETGHLKKNGSQAGKLGLAGQVCGFWMADSCFEAWRLVAKAWGSEGKSAHALSPKPFNLSETVALFFTWVVGLCSCWTSSCTTLQFVDKTGMKKAPIHPLNRKGSDRGGLCHGPDCHWGPHLRFPLHPVAHTSRAPHTASQPLQSSVNKP